MSLNYEIIRYKQGLNTRILIHCIRQFKMHWHKELELLLVLKGEVQLIVNGIRHDLKEDDMFLVNPGQVHSTIGHGDNIIVAIQINMDSYDSTYPQMRDTVFEWPTADYMDKNPEFYAEMRSTIAQMVGEYRRSEKGYQIAVESYLNAILILILRNISHNQKNDTLINNKDLLRIQSIMKYVEEHYTEKISLEQISKNEFMSTYYLSHFFKAKMGIPFQEYLNYVRLNKAIMQLSKSKDNITDIALDCGFANVKSFNNAFREAYGTTPGEYRRANELKIREDSDRMSYMEFDSFQALSKLETYILKEHLQTKPLVQGKIISKITIDTSEKGTTFIKWKQLASVGRAYDCLRADLQVQIRLAKIELGIEYLRFHGIFSDEMRVVTRDKDGKLIFCWQYVDIVCDFLYGQGIHPIIDFTFMPQAISSKDITVFWYKGNIAKPNRIEEWQGLVHSYVTHCINRYGITEVRKWYFEIWNEPDYMWGGTTEDYYDLFKATALTLRSVDDELKITGPSVMSPKGENLSWVERFIGFVNEEKLSLDVFSYHIYGEDDYTMKNGSIVPQLGDKEYFTSSIEEFERYIERLEVPVKEVFITEYNISAMHRNYLLDTMFAACHMLYNFIKNHNKVNGIVTWTLSDIFEEDDEPDGPFYGGFGMITKEGIRKPTWYAQKFLSQLGDEVLQQEEEYIVTRRGEDIQILAFSYAFYDDLYRAGDRSLLTFDHRNDVFGSKDDLQFHFDFNKINGLYEKREYILDREHGSAYDIYERMGLYDNLSAEDVTYLSSMARPHIKVNTISVHNELTIDMHIPPHGICMIQLKKLY